MAQIDKREAEDKDEERLLSIGWKFAGLALFEYPLLDTVRGYYTKEQAINLTEELMLDVYCPVCGSCGEEGCCRPEMCKCFYAEHYNKTYHELLDEHEQFLNLLKALVDTSGEYDRDDQIADACQLLEELGYGDNIHS